MDVRRQIALVRAWFPMLVASVLLTAGAALLVSTVQQKVYEARATLIVGQSLSAANPDYNQLLVSQRLSATYAALATTRPVLDAVIKQLNPGVTPDELLKRVRADAPLDSTLLTIFAQDADPSRAAAVANAVAQQLIEASPAIQGRQAEFQKSIDAELQSTQDQIAGTQAQADALVNLPTRTSQQEASLQTLEDRLARLRSVYVALLPFASGNASNLLGVVEPAVPPITPVSPKPLLNTLVGAILGLLVALGFIFIAEYLDDTVKDQEAVQETANLGTLGTIPRMSRDRGRGEIYQLASLLYPRSGVAEAYRTLRANVEFASVDRPIQTLLVTSPLPSEGKTVTAANLAVVFAQSGRQVLLVDADLRKPGVHLVLGLPNTDGLTTLLRGDDVGLDRVARTTEQANLRVITTGPVPPNPVELLGSQRMRTVLDRLKTGGDLIIFDSPPLQTVTDAVILSSFVDGTLLVIDAGHSRRRAVRLAGEALVRAGAHVLGAVVNRLPDRAHAEYGHYYGDPCGFEDETEKRVPAAQESQGATGSMNPPVFGEIPAGQPARTGTADGSAPHRPRSSRTARASRQPISDTDRPPGSP